MLTATLVYDGIGRFGASISRQPLGLALHRPQVWALPSLCFANALRQTQIGGGRVVYGWMFHYRRPDHLPETGYLVANHHAVWCDPTGHLYDVTPLHADPKHHPVMQDDGVLIQVDDAAQPVQIDNRIAPRPMRYFALTEDASLAIHIDGLRGKEEARCQAIYARLRTIVPKVGGGQ